MEDRAEFPVSWYDGRNARRHQGSARWDGAAALWLVSDWGDPLSVPLADLKHVDSHRNAEVYTRQSEPDFRLTLPSPLPQDLAAAMPRAARYGGWIDRHGLARMSIAFGLVSAVLVALFLTAPDWLGPRIPQSWERRMGEAMIGDFGNRICHTPAGDRALARLTRTIGSGNGDLRIGVANIEMVNAVALPGGQILIFDGLLQEAESPEEVAGVLAHEIGHVRKRHVMTALLRQFGLTILASGFNSGFAQNAFGLASLGYSREAEREADEFARSQMKEARVSPLGAAGFFDRMAKQYGDEAEDRTAIAGWIATHPSSGERAREYRKSFDKAGNYRPVMSAQDFDALKSMCAEDEDVESFDFF